MRKVMLSFLLTAATVCGSSGEAGHHLTSSFTGQGLGMLPGDNQAIGFGVNDAGSVVGRSANPLNEEKAFFWDRPSGVLYQLTTSGATGVAWAIAGGSGGIAYAVGHERAAGGSARAVIWVAPPSSGPIFLDASTSFAFGVNDNGVAVGWRSGLPVIWAPDGNGGYVATNIALLPDHVAGSAEDINNDGIVVGYDVDAFDQPLGFLRLANGAVIELAPAQGDTHSRAVALSNVFTESDDGFVYVAGETIDANGDPRGVRWTVNVETGVVTASTVLNMRSATGVNDAGDVAGNRSGRRQSATLWRNGTYITLEPPKGGRSSACRGLARRAALPSYVAGDALIGRRAATTVQIQAVVWDVN